MKRRAIGLALGVMLAMGCGDEGDGGRRDGGRDTQELDCPELIACVEACATDTCVEGCIDDASSAAIQIVTNVLECVETHGCGEDDACIAVSCETEIAACGVDFDPGDLEPPGDGFPTRITGTLRDYVPSSGITDDSVATVTFVRDDEGGPAAGFPSNLVVAYRVETITYRATRSGTIAPCTYEADETETFENPPLVGNYLVIERATDADGGHVYSVGTDLSVDHPAGLTKTCAPPFEASSAMEAFEAALHVSSRPETPTTDLVTFQGSKDIGGVRTISWDLETVE